MNIGLRILTRLLCVAATGFLLLAAPGCGKAAEELSEAAIESSMPDGSNVEIDMDNDAVSVQTSDGQGGTASMQTGASVALPDNFPDDIPVPDGVTWNLVQSTSDGGASGVTAQGMLKTPVADVAASMKKEAEANGWINEQTVQQGGQMEMLVYKKGERMLHISVTDTGDETALVISSQ